MLRTNQRQSAVGAVLVLGCLVTAGPAAAEEVVVLSYSAEIMSGTTVLARPKFLDRFKLLDIKSRWHNIEFQLDGQTRRGWIHAAHLLPRDLTQDQLTALENSLDTLHAAGKQQERGDHRAAIEQGLPAYETLRRTLGEEHLLVPTYATALATQYDILGDYAHAAPLHRQALETVSAVLGEDHPTYSESVNSVAVSYYDLGEYARAEPLYRRVVEIRKAVLGEDHPDYASALNNLAMVSMAMADPNRAEPLYRQALKIREAALGKNHPQYAQSLNNLARLCQVTGDYAQAEPLYREALEVYQAVLGQDHPDYARTLQNLAQVYQQQGDDSRAEPMFRQVLEIRKAILGEEHPDYAESLNNLATFYSIMRDYAQAEPLFRQALQIRKTLLGEHHPHYAASLNGLGVLYLNQGDDARAEPLIQQALQILKANLGEKHPDYAISLSSLAALYKDRGDHARAEPLYRQVLEIREAVLGKNHPLSIDSLNTLATLYLVTGDYARAEPLYRQALESTKAILGEKHPDYADSLDSLAAVYYKMGDYGRAVPLFQEVVALRKAVQGEDHLDYGRSLKNLGGLYSEMGDEKQAEPLLRQAVEIYKAVLGEEHPDYAESLTALAIVYRNMIDHARAEPLFRQALEIYKSVRGENHLDYANVLHHLAVSCQIAGDYGTAETLLRQVLEIRKAALGEDHNDYANALSSLGLVCDRMGDYTRAEALFLRSLEIRKAALGEQHPNYAVDLHRLGLLYHDLGDYARAEPLYRKSLEISKAARGERDLLYDANLGNLGGLYFDLGDYDRAKPLLLEALELRKAVEGPDSPGYANAVVNVARLYAALEDYAQAEPLYREALAVYKAVYGENHRDYGLGLNNLAVLCEAIADYQQAERLYREAIEVRQAALGENHPDYSQSLNNLGAFLGQRERWAEAADQFSQARRATRRHVARILPGLSEEQRQAFLGAPYEYSLGRALSLSLARPDDAGLALLAAEWAVNGKGVVHEASAAQALLARESGNPEVAAVAQELVSVRQRLAALSLKVPAPGQVEAHRSELAALDRQEVELGKRLGRATGTDVPGDPWVDLGAVRKVLESKTVLVEIVRIPVVDFTADQYQPAHYVAWIVPSEGETPVACVDLGEAATIEQTVADLRAEITAAPQALGVEGDVEATAVLDKHLRQVAQQVLDPLLLHMSDATNVVLSPDAGLWLVPWAALPLADGSYLIEKHTLSYVVSGRDLVRPTGPKAQSPPMIVANPRYGLPVQDVVARTERLVGELARRGTSRASQETIPTNWFELPGTEAEARAIAPRIDELAGGEPQLYLQADAVEGVVKAAYGPRMLILSTHGYFLPDQEVKLDENARLADDDRPKPALTVEGKPLENPLLRCGLVFAGANTRNQRTDETADDGLLTGLEIVGMDLRGTELVVLSACETGLGDVRNGEGVAGLRQAFQLAGAESVLATLWQIPDQETAQIMSDFFANLAAGQPKADSLRQAQLTMIRSRREQYGAAHPFFWAAFTLTGNGN